VNQVRGCRVPGVYPTWANRVFLAFFPFNIISNLRTFNIAFSSIPTAPTNIFSTGLLPVSLDERIDFVDDPVIFEKNGKECPYHPK